MEAIISKQIIQSGKIREKDEKIRQNALTEKLKMTTAAYGSEIRAAALFGLCTFLYSTTSVFLSLYMSGLTAGTEGTAGAAGILVSAADYTISGKPQHCWGFFSLP